MKKIAATCASFLFCAYSACMTPQETMEASPLVLRLRSIPLRTRHTVFDACLKSTHKIWTMNIKNAPRKIGAASTILKTLINKMHSQYPYFTSFWEAIGQAQNSISILMRIYTLSGKTLSDETLSNLESLFPSMEEPITSEWFAEATQLANNNILNIARTLSPSLKDDPEWRDRCQAFDNKKLNKQMMAALLKESGCGDIMFWVPNALKIFGEYFNHEQLRMERKLLKSIAKILNNIRKHTCAYFISAYRLRKMIESSRPFCYELVEMEKFNLQIPMEPSLFQTLIAADDRAEKKRLKDQNHKLKKGRQEDCAEKKRLNEQRRRLKKERREERIERARSQELTPLRPLLF
ncbi:MAG: hypothetical protein LBO02_01860 [Holosporaceae bacterium]|nr:hypothetical protein [Holosporaceae bacterium]